MSSPAWNRRRRHARQARAIARGLHLADLTVEWCTRHGIPLEPWQTRHLWMTFVNRELRKVP